MDKTPVFHGAILNALAQYPQGRSAVQIALLTGYSSNSGGFNNSLSKLRTDNFITRGQPIQITEEGKEGRRRALPNHKFRVIEGKCDASYSTVTRTQSQFELETGKTEAWYSVAQ